MPDLKLKAGAQERLDRTRETVLRNMVFYLATDWYPWGFKPNRKAWASLPLCPADRAGVSKWIMCCGNWLTEAEGEQAVGDGLMKHGPRDNYGRRTLLLGPKGVEWLEKHWPCSFDAKQEDRADWSIEDVVA